MTRVFPEGHGVHLKTHNYYHPQQMSRQKLALISVKWSFPGLLLNKNEAPLYNSSLTRNLKSGEVQKAIYGFDVMQELVEGEWIVSVWHAKKLLHTQTFTVKVGKK